MKNYKLLNFLLINLFVVTFFFVQCTKEIIVPLPFYEGKSVLNSLVRKDSILTLTLSKSAPINDQGITRINNADISVFQNDSFFDSLYSIGDGIYRTHKKISQSTNYSVIAQFEDELLSSSDYLPNSPQLLSLKRTDKGGVNADGYYGTLEIELLDESIQADFYEIEIIYFSIERGKEYPLYPRSNTDKVILNENLPPYANRQPFPFSDEVFNGDTIKIIFEYYTPRLILNGNEQEIDPDYFLIVKFRKTSENYYLYRKSVINHFEGQDSDIWNGIGSPTNVHSNIEGGMGIFAAYSEIIDTLKRNDL